MKVDSIWGSFLDIIKEEMNPASYHAWFEGLKVVKADNEVITIQVPMEIHKKILGDN